MLLPAPLCIDCIYQCHRGRRNLEQYRSTFASLWRVRASRYRWYRRYHHHYFSTRGWLEYGDNFFFIDHLRYSVNNDANFPVDDSSEFYGEWYSNFSLGAITGNKIAFGPVKDIGIVAGFNFAPEVDSMWLLPGVRFSLDLPSFAFAQIDVTGYVHQGGGSKDSSVFTVVDEDSSFMVDFAWAYPFKIGSTSWSIEGHL